MAAALEIRDGDPWWISPDIWVVSGTPEGERGMPIAGEVSYVFASVLNRGSSPIKDATVKFYWANPAVGFDRTTATFIGESFVSLAVGESNDVLCLTPWYPPLISDDGHVCVLAEAFHSRYDPLPPSPDFAVPMDRHVAQRNLQVVHAKRGRFAFSFEAFNTKNREQHFDLLLQPYAGSNVKMLLKEAGIDDSALQPSGKFTNVQMRHTSSKLAEVKNDPSVLWQATLKMAPHSRAGFRLTGVCRGGVGVVDIVQKNQRGTAGGLTLIVATK